MFNRVMAMIRKKDLLLELRQQHTFYGILLYIASTVFVLYLTLPDHPRKPGMEQPVLGDTTVCLRQHRGEKFSAGKPGAHAVFYSIVSPVEFVLAKLVFNAVLMLLMSLVSLTLFFFFSTTRFLMVWQFIGIVLLGGLGISLVLH